MNPTPKLNSLLFFKYFKIKKYIELSIYHCIFHVYPVLFIRTVFHICNLNQLVLFFLNIATNKDVNGTVLLQTKYLSGKQYIHQKGKKEGCFKNKDCF